MTEEEFNQALRTRRIVLKMTYRDIHRQTGLGYNTVRRIFQDPINSGICSLIRVAEVLNCKLVLTMMDDKDNKVELTI
jgi:transcriptional regulator with XRE-family HTH domain